MNMQYKNSFLRIVRLATFSSLLLLVFMSAGCKAKTLSSTEVGIMVANLPGILGGGIKEDVVPSGETKIYPLWNSMYVVDCAVASVSWGQTGRGDDKTHNDSINTRGADGNEVQLDISVQYHLDPVMAKTILMKVGDTHEQWTEAVNTWARSHIRTHFGMLMTDQFYDNTLRYTRSDETRAALNKDLNPFGIVVDTVIFDEHIFAHDYQTLIDQAKEAEQKAQGKKNEVATKKADWLMQFQQAEATYNELVATAKGYERQTTESADAYFKQKENEAKAILVAGENEVKGIQLAIEALQAGGGINLVRLAYGRALLESQARFVAIQRGESQPGNLDLTQLNINDVLTKFGALALAGESPVKKTEQPKKADPSPSSK